jgi:type 2 lantibiotic biosynthesis protein LanM
MHTSAPFDQDILHIAERASTLSERLQNRSVSPQPAHDETEVQERLEKWCRVVAAGDWEKFKRRLAWDGFDLVSVRPHLETTFACGLKGYPQWLHTLDALLAFVARFDPGHNTNHGRFVVSSSPVPFEELLVPLVEFAKNHLPAVVGTNCRLLSAEAHTMMERHLLQVLASPFSQPLYLEFCIYRARQQSPLARLISRVNPDTDDRLYCQFVDHMLHEGLKQFFTEYSFLARQIATILKYWVDSTAEFLQRLSGDWTALSNAFHAGKDLGEVMHVELGSSDRHKGGRSVVILTFACGLRLVYKPKDLELEEILFELLAWFNRNGAPLELKILRVLNCGEYGWVEFAEHLPCRDRQEAQRFFRRMGMLACVVYALRGKDYHCQNIIASGEHPVLVDAETLLHPELRDEGENQGQPGFHRLGQRVFCNSVLGTGFLPGWTTGRQGTSVDLSGLGGFGEREAQYRELEWKRTNTDDMDLGYTFFDVKASANLPVLDGQLLNSDEYLEDFCTGFQQMYHFFEDKRDRIFSSGCPIARFSSQKTRVLFRDTRSYALLLIRTMHPVFCRIGIDCSIEWDLLSQPYCSAQSRPTLWKVLQAEQNSLAQLDVPYFTAFSDRSDLELESGEVVCNCIATPGYDACVSLISHFCTDDLDAQLGFIRSAFYSRTLSRTAAIAPKRHSDPPWRASDAKPLSEAEILEEVIRIARGLRERAIWSTDGSATWIGTEYDFRSRRYQLRPLGCSLYGGTSGIALFLSAVESYTRGGEFADLAHASVLGLRQQIRGDAKAFSHCLPIGGMEGLGSIVYALLRMSDFLHSEELLQDAILAASLITNKVISSDQNLDLVSGAAGAAIALSELFKRVNNEPIILKAVQCGEHLLKTRRPSPAGPRAWPARDGQLLTGCSHGAAGIAYALLKLHEVTGDTGFLEAAVEGMDYERSVYSDEASNWPDFRNTTASEQPLFAFAWCHGAPGIGLARIASLDITDTTEIRQEVDRAVTTTAKCGLGDVDHLCCGVCGRADFLLEAGRRLSRPELVEMARQQLAAVVRLSGKLSSFRLFPSLPRGVYNPGLLQGVAGIGYELLRSANYEGFMPSILLLQ